MRRVAGLLFTIAVVAAITVVFVSPASAGRSRGCSNVSYVPSYTPADNGGPFGQGEGIWNGASEQWWGD